KLQELIGGRPITYAGQQFVNGALFIGGLSCGIALVAGVQDEWLLWVTIAASLAFGVLFVLPIGGADMPVVILLLNAFTGSAAAEDVAVMLAYAHKVVFVPGYGLAVAQAQHDVRQLADLLEAKGVEVSYAIHPVAGRMPGHMNVLLAEANVPYPQLKEMDEINPEFQRTDVALVVGANDVV